MNCYVVSAPSKRVVIAYAKWKSLPEKPVRTVMRDGWTLPSLRFTRLYEAQVACYDLAMVSGSVKPFKPHDVLITEFFSEIENSLPTMTAAD